MSEPSEQVYWDAYAGQTVAGSSVGHPSASTATAIVWSRVRTYKVAVWTYYPVSAEVYVAPGACIPGVWGPDAASCWREGVGLERNGRKGKARWELSGGGDDSEEV